MKDKFKQCRTLFKFNHVDMSHHCQLNRYKVDGQVRAYVFNVIVKDKYPLDSLVDIRKKKYYGTSNKTKYQGVSYQIYKTINKIKPPITQPNTEIRVYSYFMWTPDTKEVLPVTNTRDIVLGCIIKDNSRHD